MNKNLDKSTVSIIMPTYNSGSYISESINSVIHQTISEWELIIIDDNSTDSTINIIEKFTIIDNRIKLIKLDTNRGAANARNIGIQNAKSRYIAFLDSDDIWHFEKLEKQLAFMEKNDVKISCTNYGKIDNDGIITKRIIKNRGNIDYKALLKNPPGNSSVMYDSLFVGIVQIPNIRKRNDYVMWLQIIKITKSIYTIDEVLMYHRVRKGSLSKNKISLIKYHWYIYRKIENLSVYISLKLIMFWIIKSTLSKLRNIK